LRARMMARVLAKPNRQTAGGTLQRTWQKNSTFQRLVAPLALRHPSQRWPQASCFAAQNAETRSCVVRLPAIAKEEAAVALMVCVVLVIEVSAGHMPAPDMETKLSEALEVTVLEHYWSHCKRTAPDSWWRVKLSRP